MDIRDLHGRAVAAFGERVQGTPAGAWCQPTPCQAWNVTALVNHVVGENLWIPPLMSGATVADVGDRFDGDVLGGDPVGAWDRSLHEASTAVAAVDLDATVHLSFADVPASEYLWQLTADAAVHAWDLARATGQDESFDADLVQACLDWFRDMEDLYRSAGAIGPAVELTEGATAQDELLARFGRDPSPDSPLAVVVRFNDAFGRGDLAAVSGLITDDCVFEDTSPPDGGHHEGRAAVEAAFSAFFAGSPSNAFRTEDGFVAGDRVAIAWRYQWADGLADHIRGVDLFHIRGGRVAAKLAYVKG
jgi:uncharacterized protein (TIGR03086 family)